MWGVSGSKFTSPRLVPVSCGAAHLNTSLESNHLEMAEAHVLCAQCAHFLYFWQCVRSVLILLHRPFAKTFGVIRGVVKLCEPLATSLFAASAAYLACVAGDTYSVSAEPCHSSEDTKIYGSPWAGNPRGGFVMHRRLSHKNAACSLPQHH